MSRIGIKPIEIGDSVEVIIDNKRVDVKGPKANLMYHLPECIAVTLEDKVLRVSRVNNSRQAKAFHGLARSLLANMVKGVNNGFQKKLEIRGVGYRAQVQGMKLILSLGYSHPVEFIIPPEITVTAQKNIISIEGADKQQVGQAAATIRAFRKPEPYKGKGIRYLGEYVAQKAGKST